MDLQSTALPLSQLAGLSRIGVDAEGLEPTTKGLKGPCSTIELRIHCDPTGIRTPIAAVKGRSPNH